MEPRLADGDSKAKMIDLRLIVSVIATPGSLS
jgi:hypothetical protein